MFLSVLAALFQVSAYVAYFTQVSAGGSIPNPASWSVWALLSVLNALTFWRASKDALATAQFFTGSVACVTVWTYSLTAGKFVPLDAKAWFVLIFCFVACAIWYVKQSAIYANLVIAGIFVISSVPTFMGVWRNSNVEQPLAWILWTTAFAVTTINVFRRTDRTKSRWWFIMAMPAYGLIFHGLIAICAAQ